MKFKHGLLIALEARNLLDRGAYATGWRLVSVFREGWGLKLVAAPFADCRDPE